MTKQLNPNWIDEKSCTLDQLLFWKQLSHTLFFEKGNPFWFSARKNYAHINAKMSMIVGQRYCLCLEYVPGKKAFRIVIYIADDTQSQVWDVLLSHKDEIEHDLDVHHTYKPIWCSGEKNYNTKRIQTVLPLYDYTDRNQLIEEIIYITKRYLQVFPKYLPKLFN